MRNSLNRASIMGSMFINVTSSDLGTANVIVVTHQCMRRAGGYLIRSFAQGQHSHLATISPTCPSGRSLACLGAANSKSILEPVGFVGQNLDYGAFVARAQLDAETSAQGSDLGQSQIDVALVVVIQAWPHLPEAIRKGILAMARAAAQS